MLAVLTVLYPCTDVILKCTWMNGPKCQSDSCNSVTVCYDIKGFFWMPLMTTGQLVFWNNDMCHRTGNNTQLNTSTQNSSIQNSSIKNKTIISSIKVTTDAITRNDLHNKTGFSWW